MAKKHKVGYKPFKNCYNLQKTYNKLNNIEKY